MQTLNQLLSELDGPGSSGMVELVLEVGRSLQLWSVGELDISYFIKATSMAKRSSSLSTAA